MPGPDPLHEESMERVSFRIEPEKVEAIDGLVDEGEYHNQSVALREAIDLLLEEAGER